MTMFLIIIVVACWIATLLVFFVKCLSSKYLEKSPKMFIFSIAMTFLAWFLTK